jgi:glycosyltransferase involved in cell wall biosynthesis
MSRAVVVYDSDGLNPYGRELACLLADDRPSHVVCAADAEWIPDGVTTHPVLPGNRGGRSRARQLLGLVRGVLLVWWMCRPGGAQLVIVFARTPVEEAAFALLARLGGDVVLLVHEPTPRTAPTRAGAITWRSLLSRAQVVVHSEPLRQELLLASPGVRAAVCRHLPFTAWPLAYGADRRAPWGEEVRVLLLGQVRPDMGLQHVPPVLALLPPSARERLEVVLCGKGELPQGLAADLRALVRVQDRTGAAFRPDAEVAEAVRSSHVLLAPYDGASQSGTVTLALSCGLPVLGFDDGSLSDLVDSTSLVPTGDHAALAALISAFLSRRQVCEPRMPVADWRDEVRQQWVAVLGGTA